MQSSHPIQSTNNLASGLAHNSSIVPWAPATDHQVNTLTSTDCWLITPLSRTFWTLRSPMTIPLRLLLRRRVEPLQGGWTSLRPLLTGVTGREVCYWVYMLWTVGSPTWVVVLLSGVLAKCALVPCALLPPTRLPPKVLLTRKLLWWELIAPKNQVCDSRPQGGFVCPDLFPWHVGQ